MDDASSRVPVILQWWGKVPAIIRAIVLGFLVMDAGVLSYAALATLNTRIAPQVPWAALVMVPLLWLYWSYLGGQWWPQATSAARRMNLRGRNLPAEVWRGAVLAGLFGIVFTLSFGSAYQRIIGVTMDARGIVPEGTNLPAWTLYPTLFMIAIVAGICEEAGIRGYLQSILERRHGPVAAILVSSLAFTYAHFGHEWGQALAVPFFVASLWYGTLTWITQSILPMIAVHIALDFYLFGQALLLGPAAAPRPLAETGLDAAFWLTAGAAALSANLLVLALRRLSRLMKKYSPVADPGPAA